MDDTTEILYTSRDMLKLILKEKSIHKGHWMFLVHFGFNGMNVGQTDTGEDAIPAGVVSVQKMGIKEISEPLPFSVDASKVNPAPKKLKKPSI